MTGHPFVRYVAALIAGIGCYVWQPGWTAVPWVAAGAGGLLGLYAGWQWRRQVVKPLSVSGSLAMVLGLLAAGWLVTYARTARNQPDNLSRLPTLPTAYEAVIAAQPEERAKTYRVELALRRGLVDQQFRPVSGRVIVYLDKSAGPLPRYGDLWLVNGSPRPIDPPLNPGEFNYKRFLAFKGIYHQQYVQPSARRVLGYDPPSRLMVWATGLNRLADSVLTRQIGTRAEYGIVNAMILGIRDDVDPAQYRAYSAAGAVHILSVSGLHVGILFFVLTWLLGKLAPGQEKRAWVAALKLAILWFYALATGLSPPVLRSAGMFTLLILAVPLRRAPSLPSTLAASAFFILLIEPYALFSAGFQLSYLAVAGIGAWVPYLEQQLTFRRRWANWLWQLTAVALVAQLVTFPLALYYFHSFPTYFLLANPVVMGLSQVLLPLALATLACCWVPGLNGLLGWLLAKTAWLLNEAVAVTGRLPGAAWDGLWPSETVLALTYALILAGVALLFTRQRTYLWISTLLVVALVGTGLYEQYAQRRQRRLAVHFLPHKTAVSLTDGHRAVLLTDADVPNDPRSYDFYLKNTFGSWGITDLTIANANADTLRRVRTYRRTREYALWVWQGKTILLVNRLTGRWRLPAVVDYLIIRRNALRDWRQLNGRLVARQIIFDDSNKTPLTDRLLAEAKGTGWQPYSVRQMGAYVVELE